MQSAVIKKIKFIEFIASSTKKKETNWKIKAKQESEPTGGFIGGGV